MSATHSGFGQIVTVGEPRLLAGLDADHPTANLARHRQVHGNVTAAANREQLRRELEAAGLRGRGGAGFPTHIKVASLGKRRSPVVVVNASEGEPLSRKDAVIMARVPHLMLDGAIGVALAIDADRVIVYLHDDRAEAYTQMQRAVAERSDTVSIEIKAGPARYIAGEASAAVAFLSGGAALPTRKPPQPTEKGVGGRPTFISNAETFAHIALILRSGAAWFRSIGVASDPGTMLLTVSDGSTHIVVEAPTGTPITHVVEGVGASLDRSSAVLLGGYAGTWATPHTLAARTLDRDVLAKDGLSLGVGQIALLPTEACYLRETASLTRWLAGETAGQCGPCVHGLPDIASMMHRIATSATRTEDTDTLLRWADLVDGRGACGHPGGVSRLVRSAIALSPEHLHQHHLGGCRVTAPVFPIPMALAAVSR